MSVGETIGKTFVGIYVSVFAIILAAWVIAFTDTLFHAFLHWLGIGPRL